jgi:hypothetical protein
MSCTTTLMQMSGVPMRRAGWLLLGGVLLCPLIGCTGFQSMCTNDWLNAKWIDSSPEQPVHHLLSRWDNRVKMVEDTVNRGSAVPVLAGVLYLFNDQTHSCVDARGSVVVQLHDITHVAAGKPAEKMAEWRFDAERLRMLKRKDRIGEGYVLALPWYEYRPDIKEVRLQICYLPEKGTPRNSEPQNVTLQPADQPVPVVEERRFVPALQPPPFPPTAQQQSIEQPSLPQQPQGIPGRN